MNDKVVLILFDDTPTVKSVILRLARAGARLVLLCRSQEQTAVRQLKQENKVLGSNTRVFTGDWRQPEFVNRVRGQLTEKAQLPNVFLDLRSQTKNGAVTPFSDNLRLIHALTDCGGNGTGNAT